MPVPATPPPLSRSLLRDDVFRRLRGAIVDGTLVPGEQLRDQELAAWLGVSRTPVREALLRLSHAGLVVSAPGRSTRVASIDHRAVHDAQSVVATLHRLAVLEGGAHLGADGLAAMRAQNAAFADALRDGDVEAALAADDAFHGVVVRACGNAALAAVLDDLTPVLRRVERLRFSSLSARGSVRTHDRIVDLLAAGDVTAAADACHENWQTLEPLLSGLDDPTRHDPIPPDPTPLDPTPHDPTPHDPTRGAR